VRRGAAAAPGGGACRARDTCACLADATVQDALSQLRPLLLGAPGVRAVVAAPPGAPPELRRVLLSAQAVPPAVASGDAALPPRLAAFLAAPRDAPATLVRHELRLPYDAMSAAVALRLLLPAGVAAPSSFEEVGHIVHLNLRAPQLPWARLIGAVLLDKSARAATVVNKAGELEGPHRTFALQLLAGEARYGARVSEGGALYDVDVSAVYWNSRLGSERARLVARFFKPGETVLDLCAGVGPIAIAAARAGCTVLANDLNPAAATALRSNAALNGVASAVRIFNGDGVAVARQLLAQTQPPPLAHVVANLPGGAPELVGAALARAFSRAAWGDRQLPECHVYAFSKAAVPEEDVLRRCAAALRVPPAVLQDVQFATVREVAPGKPMLRASFRIPPQAAFDDAP
jgi:tRNA (guanine37-N1)-methyltransferase